jgi:hypothetical protein
MKIRMKRESTRASRLGKEIKNDYEDECGASEFEKPVQVVKVIGSLVFCSKCGETSSFYCSCGSFFCAFDLVSHICINTLKQSYSEDLKRALR